MDFMQWFGDNKDTMLNAIINIANFTKLIAQTFAGAINVFGGNVGGTTSLASDTINNMSTYRNVVINVTQSNNISTDSNIAASTINNELSESGIRRALQMVSSAR